MSDSYIPLFSDTLTSSVWALDSETRVVWFTVLLLVDHKGFVSGTVPGIAIAANVPEAKVREAMARFESPDPDSRTSHLEGRRLVKVDRGWHLVNHEAMRDRAKLAAERARKARWARDNGKGKQLDLPFPDDSTPPSEPLDAQKQQTQTTNDLPSEDEESFTTARFIDSGEHFVLAPTVIHRIPDDWRLGDELRAEAIAAGVHPDDIDRRFDELKGGPIGGRRGIFAANLSRYVRRQFGKWKTWGEEDRAKALAKAQGGGARPFAGRGAPPPTGPEPSPAQRAFAAHHGIDLIAVIEELVRRNYTTANYTSKELTRNLTAALNRAKRAKEAA